jgi:hypothetical protein
MTRRWSTVAIVALLAFSATLRAPAPTFAADPERAAAERLAAEHGGSPNDYRVVYDRPAGVRGTGETLWAAKLAGPDGKLHAVYRDAAGRLGDKALFDDRVRQYVEGLPALGAKADAALRSRVSTAAADADVPVAVWLAADATEAVAAVAAAHPEVEWAGGRPVVTDLGTARAIRAELYEARRGIYAAAADALDAAVAELGGTLAYASPTAPIAFVDLPASAVDELAALASVETLGLERTWTPTMTTAGPTVDANWTSGSGDQGAGVRVAVVEYHNVRKVGDLAGRVVASHSSSGTLAYTPAGTFDHPSWVAGAIAGGGTYGGVAPGSRIVSASTGGGGAGLARDRAVIATADWAISPSGGDADIVSLSLIQDTTTGAEEARRYFDSVVDEDLRLVVSASGNFSAAGTWRVGSPGTGWNVLTVGGTDDRNTKSRSDDRIWYVPGGNGSSYVDPPGTAWNAHGDFNKPNLSAPAVGVRTANGLAASGTSVATPIVSGIAAQILARAPTLATWPEGARAVLMAGAAHHTKMPNGGINADHEGTGSASALWSNRILVAGDGAYGGYRLGSMSGTFSQGIQVSGGQRVRVVVSWNSRTSGSSNLSKTDTLASDLDLRLRLPNGATYGSFSFDNTYEVVDVVSPVGGTATIEVIGTRVASGGERYGLAWAKIGGDTSAPRVTTRAPASGEPWAAPETSVTATFSEPVTGFSASSVVLRPAGGGAQIPASLSYWAPARRLTVTPSDPLGPGGYTLSLGSGIRDLSSNNLTSTSWSFTVVDYSTDPWSAAVIPPERVTFSPGSYIGYQFDGNGNVTASRLGVLTKTSGADADRRGVIAGQPGRWLRIVNGIWAGYWVRESSRVRLAGQAETQSLPSTTRVTFTNGSHTGYQFSVGGAVTAYKKGSIAGTSGANANARAVFNGLWYLRITNGMWAGYWIPEGPRSYVAGLRDHLDLAGGVVRFSAGRYTGHRFNAGGGITGSKTGTLASSSSAPAIAWAVVNGTPRYLIGAGLWSGTWVPESPAVQSP